MDCPICDYKNLGADKTNCPSCNTDLTAYHALDAVEASMKKQKRCKFTFIILFILALLGCVAIYFILSSAGPTKENKDNLVKCENELQSLKAENEQLRSTIADLQHENAKLMEAKNQQPVSTQLTHVINEGETLFFIARTYLGNGSLYPRIAADNNIENPDLIFTGATLIINK